MDLAGCGWIRLVCVGGSVWRASRGRSAAQPGGSGAGWQPSPPAQVIRWLWAAHSGAASVGARSDWDWSILGRLRLSATRKEVARRSVGVLAALGCVDQRRYCVGVVVVLLRVKA